MCSNNKHTTSEIENYILVDLNKNISFKELRDNYGLLINRTAFQEQGISVI